MKTHHCPLPEELLLEEILPRMPTKSVVRFKSVSKTWQSLISQHSLLIATKHTAADKPGSIFCGRYINDPWTRDRRFFLGSINSNVVEIDISYLYKKRPHRFALVGAHNGLVCLKLVYYDTTHDLVFWNPATREVNYLPVTAEAAEYEWISGYALGFDANSRVHKVVWLKQTFEEKLEAQVFSQKSGRWRSLEWFVEISDAGLFFDKGEVLSVDGAIYWKAWPFNILSFDVSKEEFREFEGPLRRRRDCINFDLINWKGCMGVVFVLGDPAEIQVWLKNKDTNESYGGWNKISIIQPSLPQLLLRRVFSGHILHLSYSDAKKEILYDLVTEEKRESEIGGVKNVSWFQSCDHSYTLIPPN